MPSVVSKYVAIFKGKAWPPIMHERDKRQEAQARLAYLSECPVRHDIYMSVAFFCPSQTRRTYASSTTTHDLSPAKAMSFPAHSLDSHVASHLAALSSRDALDFEFGPHLGTCRWLLSVARTAARPLPVHSHDRSTLCPMLRGQPPDVHSTFIVIDAVEKLDQKGRKPLAYNNETYVTEDGSWEYWHLWCPFLLACRVSHFFNIGEPGPAVPLVIQSTWSMMSSSLCVFLKPAISKLMS